MKKQSLLYWFVAFVCAALIFTGCPQEADNDPEPTAAEKAAAELGAALGDAATVSGTTVTLTKDYTVDDAATLAVPAGVTLVVPSGKTFKVTGALNVAEGAEVTVESGGVFFLDGTGLGEGETNGALGGTITIKPGAKTYSTGTFGGSGWTVIEAGGLAYAEQSPDDNAPATIGGADATLNLTSGSFALNTSGYILNGNATITKHFGMTNGISLLIKTGGKLTIDIDATINDTYWPGFWILNANTKITGETGSVIEVVEQKGENKFGKIVFDITDNDAPTVNFYGSDGGIVTTDGSKHAAVPYGTYNWDTTLGESNNASGWKAEAEEEGAT